MNTVDSTTGTAAGLLDDGVAETNGTVAMAAAATLAQET
jgi:hypothetical protein